MKLITFTFGLFHWINWNSFQQFNLVVIKLFNLNEMLFNFLFKMLFKMLLTSFNLIYDLKEIISHDDFVFFFNLKSFDFQASSFERWRSSSHFNWTNCYQFEVFFSPKCFCSLNDCPLNDCPRKYLLGKQITLRITISFFKVISTWFQV